MKYKGIAEYGKEDYMLKKCKINECVTFVPGMNQTRVNNNIGLNYYDQSSFDEDYKHEKVYIENYEKKVDANNRYLTLGDIVISNSLQRATIVGSSNVGKVLSLNFTKVNIDSKKIDQGYFLYLFNENKSIRRQKDKEMQRSGAVYRIPLKSLSEIIIPVVSIEEQRKIGGIYIETLKLQSKLSEYSELIDQFINGIIEESLREE